MKFFPQEIPEPAPEQRIADMLREELSRFVGRQVTPTMLSQMRCIVDAFLAALRRHEPALDSCGLRAYVKQSSGDPNHVYVVVNSKNSALLKRIMKRSPAFGGSGHVWTKENTGYELGPDDEIDFHYDDLDFHYTSRKKTSRKKK